MPELKLDDIQGIIISGYGHLPVSCYLFLECPNPAGARAWIGALLPQITHACWKSDGVKEKPGSAVNLAFTARGLARLGVDTASFPQEFREGMVEDHRSRRLGDTDANAPAGWDIGGPNSGQETIHVLLMLYAADGPGLDSLLSTHRALFSQPEYNLHEIAAERGDRSDGNSINNHEHFGFHDSIGQPEIEGAPRPRSVPARDCLKAGEFILGYPNEYGKYAPTPTAPASQDPGNLLPDAAEAGVASAGTSPLRDLGRSGSYLVFRKLEQNVPLFRQYLARVAPDPTDQAILGAKMVGRWSSGTPLVLAPDHDEPRFQDANEFNYMDTDPYGYACPIGAHIRRSNPRDSLAPDAAGSLSAVRRHRILRRGTLYGKRLPPDVMEDDGERRGLLFFCLNADIERQFEFVQQTWINNPKFNGLYTDRDPLIGQRTALTASPLPSDDFTIQGQPVRQRLGDLPQFVTVKGGGYFFLPGLAALLFLSRVGG